MSTERGPGEGGGFRLVEDEPGSLGNARFLCEAAALAYLPAAAGAATFKALLGLDARLFSEGNTQAWLGPPDAAPLPLDPVAEEGRRVGGPAGGSHWLTFQL